MIKTMFTKFHLDTSTLKDLFLELIIECRESVFSCHLYLYLLQKKRRKIDKHQPMVIFYLRVYVYE